MIFNHIGIIVKDISKFEKKFKTYLKLSSFGKIINDKKIGVKLKFFKDKNGIKYELIEPIYKKNPLNKILKKKLNSIHHIAYKVNNFENECLRLRNEGFGFLTKPLKAKAFKNKNVIFLISKENFIIELIES